MLPRSVWNRTVWPNSGDVHERARKRKSKRRRIVQNFLGRHSRLGAATCNDFGVINKKAAGAALRLSIRRCVVYDTVILRGLTCSAFGRVNVTTPCSIFALTLSASIDGSSSKVRR